MKEKGGCKIGLKAPEGSPLGGCKEGLKAKKRIKFKVVDEPKVEPKKKLYVNDPGKAKKKSQQPAQQAKVIAPKPRVAKVAKVIKEAQKDTTPLSTPPILPVNVKNAKKIVAFMEKVETDSDKRRLDGRSPTMGHSFYEFKELDGGNLKFTRNGYNKEIEIKKIMKMLKQVKKGEVSYETFLLPKYYKNYLRIIDFNPNVSSKQLF